VREGKRIEIELRVRRSWGDFGGVSVEEGGMRRFVKTGFYFIG